MSCGVGLRHRLDPTLLWLWCRPAAAAPIGLLAWEPPYAPGSYKAKKILGTLITGSLVLRVTECRSRDMKKESLWVCLVRVVPGYGLFRSNVVQN